jgi:hypothetical protein
VNAIPVTESAVASAPIPLVHCTFCDADFVPISEGNPYCRRCGSEGTILRPVSSREEVGDILAEAIAIIEDELYSVIDCHTIKGPDGKPDLATLDEDVRPLIEKWESLIARGRLALTRASAGGNAPAPHLVPCAVCREHSAPEFMLGGLCPDCKRGTEFRDGGL